MPEFKLERYLDRYEFSAPYLLCCSDCEAFSVGELLEMEGESALENLLNLPLNYTETRGNPALRREIAGLYKIVDPDQVLVFTGAEEPIFIFMNAVLERGDHIIVQYPCYQSLFEVARAAGCEVTRWVISEEEAGWEYDLDFLARGIRDNTRAIVINSPHNPTGYLLTPDKMGALVEMARARNILIFSDEVYRYLEYNEKNRPDPACDLYENAVSLGVMSKTFGLPGLRIGWIATRNREIYDKMSVFKDYTTICNSAPSEFLATLALKHRDKLVGRNLGIIRENLSLLNRFFESHANLFTWNKPQAGPIALPGIKWDGRVEDFCADLVESTGVLLLPSTCYDFGNRHFRIGFGRKNVAECVEKLDCFLEKRFKNSTWL